MKTASESHWKRLATELRTAVAATLTLAILLCGLYPLTVWALAQGLFPRQANGSLISRGGEVVGSSLIAQDFTGPRYFHPRPSAVGFDAAQSGGSNLGPTSKELVAAVAARVAHYREENGLPESTPIPPDAVTASASGLDPHISVANARLQAHRVADARGTSEEAIEAKIAAHTEGRDLGIFGEPRVNVLELNRDLDG